MELFYTGDDFTLQGIPHRGIPFLMDIPFLGWLFKAERKEEAQVELLIFLTPTVIKSVIEDMS